MNEFKKAWRRTGIAEGGYVNDPSDSGGETNHGITIRVARENGYTGRMIDMSPRQAEDIAKNAYWDVMRLDDIARLSSSLAHEIFDTGFNMGQGRASKFLQRSLNVFNSRGRHYPDIIVDGQIGSGTLSALKALLRRRGRSAETVMLNAMNSCQGYGYIMLAERREKDEDFIWGWFTHRVTIE